MPLGFFFLHLSVIWLAPILVDKSPCSGIACQEFYVWNVAWLVANIECLVVHPELVAPLHIEKDQVQQEPESEEENDASKGSSTARLVVSFPIDTKLNWLAKCIKRGKRTDKKVSVKLGHITVAFSEFVKNE